MSNIIILGGGSAGWINKWLDLLGIKDKDLSEVKRNELIDRILEFNSFKTTWFSNWKWKPSHENTIDFLVKEDMEDYILNGEHKQKS